MNPQNQADYNLWRIFEAYHQMLCILSLDGVIQVTNPAFQRMLGISGDELCSRPMIEMIHPADREAVTAWRVQIIQERRSVVQISRCMRHDGTYRWLEWTAAVDPEQQIIFAAAVDVTQRKTAEEQSARRFDLYLAHAPVAVIEWTRDFEVIEWNPAAERIFGYARSEAVGQHMAELIVPEQAKSAVGQILEHLANATGGTYSKNENVTKSGDIIFCEWHNASIQNESGEVTSVLSLALDITELHRVRRKQKEALQRFELVALGSRDGYFDYHAPEPGAPIDLNDPVFLSTSLHEMAGYAEGELSPVVGTWMKLVHPDDIDFLLRRFLDHIHSGQERAAVEHRIVKKSGEPHWVEVVWRAVYDDAGRLTRLAGALRDISERKRSEQSLRDQLAIIRQQREAIQALSSPIIEVWEGVICLPVVRLLDRERAAEMMERLLHAVTRISARFAILDLTGVETIDTETATHFLQISAAVRLLGAESIITGLRPAVAHTLVSLQIDLSAIATLPNLKEALKMCMRRLNRGA